MQQTGRHAILMPMSCSSSADMNDRHTFRGPDEGDVERIVSDAIGESVTSLRRFPTGLAHFVYDVETAGGNRFAVRLANPAQRTAFAGAVYWYERLRPLGIPLPALIYVDVEGQRHGIPVMILERLPGVDLGDVYLDLSADQRRRIAEQVVEIQRLAGSLPEGPGFGYAASYDDRRLAARWKRVLEANLDRSRRRIERAGVVDVAMVERVRAVVDRYRDDLDRVRPMCFLDDTTTKNVIVHEGRLSGIVDVDVVCFGDPVRTPALTRMALLSRGYETDYIDFWTEAAGIRGDTEQMLTLCTAVDCAGFLAEVGHAFNRAEAPPVDAAYVAHLMRVLESLLGEL
jgi:aminoglycoside phosphotransferase (APT) family kinase protein